MYDIGMMKTRCGSYYVNFEGSIILPQQTNGRRRRGTGGCGYYAGQDVRVPGDLNAQRCGL